MPGRRAITFTQRRCVHIIWWAFHVGMHLCDKTRLLTSPGSEPQGASFFFLLLCVCVRVSLSVFDILAFVHQSSAFFFCCCFFLLLWFQQSYSLSPCPGHYRGNFHRSACEEIFRLKSDASPLDPCQGSTDGVRALFFFFFFFRKT